MRVLMILFGFFALICWLVGLVTSYNTIKFFLVGVHTTGRVVEINLSQGRKKSKDGGTHYSSSSFPVVTFYVQDKVYNLESHSSVNDDKLKIGAEIEVIYDSKDPDNAIIGANWLTRLGGSLVAFVFAVALSFVTWFFYGLSLDDRPRKNKKMKNSIERQ